MIWGLAICSLRHRWLIIHMFIFLLYERLISCFKILLGKEDQCFFIDDYKFLLKNHKNINLILKWIYVYQIISKKLINFENNNLSKQAKVKM